MSRQRKLTPPGFATHSPTRRDILKTATLLGAGFWVSGRALADAITTKPSDKLNLGIIGVSGRAKGNLNEENNAVASQNIVAICDVDATFLGEAGERFPKAAKYDDFRRLIDRNDIDAVVISTADHCHAPATLLAMESGKHVYCEKPLTHTVEEARRVTETAARTKRVTQMGTQIHSGGNYRRVVELVRSGAIGPVREVHLWVGTNWSATQLPAEGKVPATFNHDMWLGPIKPRPYRENVHPFQWRRYWAFGTGSLGDMACHYMDLPFWALGLSHCTHVEATGADKPHEECAPAWCRATWKFPARTTDRGELPPVTMHWYDGGQKPDQLKEWGVPAKAGGGIVFVGDKGQLFADYNRHQLLPAEQFEGYKPQVKAIADSIGHHTEWMEAIRRNDPAMPLCRFAYSGPLAETVLLGTVAFRAGEAMEWDAKALRAKNTDKAERFIRKEYRAGWGM